MELEPKLLVTGARLVLPPLKAAADSTHAALNRRAGVQPFAFWHLTFGLITNSASFLPKPGRAQFRLDLNPDDRAIGHGSMILEL